ncbi:MAG: zinc ribbon domain-containing protein [Nitrososphaerota archaeon]|jgi:hypothetical protein|uniref:zinc ribbon domain-containing protein n=1 Tax=Candidatus Bathycorpusculum sp. TaxID=2994959 RepID=UPI00281B762B|nr:zinc ribbon domain-containing protein [Candidatus Termiticorpusculum sp.]MCL2256582.1 zinc ribbon domain-containing protein [Candidatus Termiticorpusculum sp.]MCL2291780.1 zinc ribbon domain-containing protein [Candidatus Termiticorpusculum sp.]MDR0461062.1 zinc ribbon domain-containing protein [Nitrososphaerota archaeon]
MKVCIACGMPMNAKNDYSMGDENKNYCVHCTNANGSMQTFEEKKESMTNFIVKTQNLSREAAENVALSMMKKLPAWEKQFT